MKTLQETCEDIAVDTLEDGEILFGLNQNGNVLSSSFIFNKKETVNKGEIYFDRQDDKYLGSTLLSKGVLIKKVNCYGLLLKRAIKINHIDNVRIGEKIIAKENCHSFLTKGKIYKVIGKAEHAGTFKVIDDHGNKNYFAIERFLRCQKW